MIVTDLDVTNIIQSRLQDHIITLAQIIIQHPLVSHINLTLVLANVLLVITTTLFDAINQHIVLLLYHVTTATAVALTNSKPYSNYQYKPTVNLTQQPSSLIHYPPHET